MGDRTSLSAKNSVLDSYDVSICTIYKLDGHVIVM